MSQCLSYNAPPLPVTSGVVPLFRGGNQGSKRREKEGEMCKTLTAGDGFCTKATRAGYTALWTDWVWAHMHVLYENSGLASLGGCLGRKRQCYREKEDQEGAKRKLEVQRGLKSDWRLVSAKTAWEAHQTNARNTKLMGSLVCAGSFI